MDFSNRSGQQSPAAPRPASPLNADAPARKSSRGSRGFGKWGKWGSFVLLAAVAVLILAVLGILITGGGKSEAGLVDKSKLQAVFLTNDQVYFGNITSLNGKYVALSNIYYLQTQNNGTNQQQASSSNVSLVKLGCELHKPYDRMVINRDQVQFWENLQSDGQVATVVKSYKQQNPNGQKCSTTANGATNSTNVQGTQSTPTTDTTTDTSNKNQ